MSLIDEVYELFIQEKEEAERKEREKYYNSAEFFKLIEDRSPGPLDDDDDFPLRSL
jgi:hypothetical protein